MLKRREALLVFGAVLLFGGCLVLALLWRAERDRASRLEAELATLRARRGVTTAPEVSLASAPLPSMSSPTLSAAPTVPVAPAAEMPIAETPGVEPPPPAAPAPKTAAEIAAWLQQAHEDEEAEAVQEELRARLANDPALRNDLLGLLASAATEEEFQVLAWFLASELGDLAFPALERLYTSHPDPARRRAALLAIGAIGSEPARRYLLDVLRTVRSDEGRVAAVEALGYPWAARASEAREVVGALQEMMASREPGTRQEGALALLSWAHRPEHAALVADYLAREPDEVTRICVLQTLNGHALARDPQVFAAVRRIFEDPAAARTLREVAAGVLGDTEVLDDDLAKAIERFWNE